EFPKEPHPVDIAGHRGYFFGTCNVAYRKKVLDECGLKFWERPTGEDMNLSYETRSRGYKFYFAPKAKVDHMHRADLKSLCKVWVTYGEAHAPLIDKFVKKKGLEIIFQFLKKKPSVFVPFPLKGFIYIGDFHLMHIFAFLTVLSFIFAWFTLSLFWRILLGISIFGLIWFSFQFVKWNIGMEPKNKFLVWCKYKYLTNLNFIKGGLKGFKKTKVICIEPSF
ncbi:MAG: hypothetical protein N2Z79_05030, partial [Candidatus Omnitrophica bacterium]|nr:hypothetical protein [Candidatus Omnitrophota bacterium]